MPFLRYSYSLVSSSVGVDVGWCRRRVGVRKNEGFLFKESGDFAKMELKDLEG